MRIYCKLSGTEFHLKNSFGNLQVIDRHPLFTVSLPTLLSQTHFWFEGKLDEDQRKILFLALIHKTDLVHFNAIPCPTDNIVQNNMEAAIKVAEWKDAISEQVLFDTLPQYIISHHTRDLSNISVWFQEWFSAQENWRDAYKTERHRQKLQKREEILLGYINSPNYKNRTAYIRNLADWTMTAISAPLHVKEDWTKMFFLTGLDVYKGEHSDSLESLLLHMEEGLQAHVKQASIFALKAMSHIRELQKKNESSISFGIGMLEDEDDRDLEMLEANEPGKPPKRVPFNIITTRVEEHNKKIAALDAPLEEPKQKDYASKFLYLKAVAAWTLSKKHQLKIETLQQKQLEMELSETLDAISGEEEAEIEEDLTLEVDELKKAMGENND